MLTNDDFLPITKICDELYEREKLLINNGIDSFSPRLRSSEIFANSKQELKEYRNHIITLNKKRMVWNPKANEFYKNSDYLPPYLIRQKQESFKNKVAYENFMRPFQEEALNLWREEIDRFNLGFADEWIAKSKKTASRTGMYKALMGKLLEPYGFEHDYNMTSTQYHHFSRILNDKYKLCFVLDLVNMKQPLDLSTVIVREGNDTKIRSGPGVQFDVYLALYHINSRKNDRRIIGVGFEDLFPISGQYRRYRNLNELEALIRIFATMYQLIHEELNKALLKMISDPKEAADIEAAYQTWLDHIAKFK